MERRNTRRRSTQEAKKHEAEDYKVEDQYPRWKPDVREHTRGE